MGSGKGGGGADAGPMLEYGQKGLDLQKEIYNDQKQMAQPWYNTGTSAVNQLSKLMGLGGNATAKTEAQLRQEYMPSYTSQSAVSGLPEGATDVSDRVLGFTTPDMKAKKAYELNGRTFVQGDNMLYSLDGPLVGSPKWNVAGGATSPSVDNVGLDAAVQRALAQQSANASAVESDPAYGSLAKSFGLEDYQADPGYNFRLSEGNKALERALNAQGKTYSPEAVKALQTFGQNEASQEFGNAYNRFNNDQGNLFNRLATLSGFGQTATGQVGAAGQNYANQGTELYTGMGNSIAAANQANQANKSSMFNTLLGAGAQLGSAYMFSDERLKENILPMGKENGHNVYMFNYVGEPEQYIGVMAQEVLESDPDAVILTDSGYLAVDYSQIGVKFREVKSCH